MDLDAILSDENFHPFLALALQFSMAKKKKKKKKNLLTF
jgi:hypothetical protein